MWFLENLSENNQVWFDRIKSIYDFILAFIILIITVPFWAIIALGCIMLVSARVAVPETVTGLIGAVLIALSLHASRAHSMPDQIIER